jgi:hypothetical protein
MDQSIVEKRDHNSCLFVFTALIFYEKNDLFYFATTFKVNGSKQSSKTGSGTYWLTTTHYGGPVCSTACF